MSTRRVGTLKRAKAVTEADDPHTEAGTDQGHQDGRDGDCRLPPHQNLAAMEHQGDNDPNSKSDNDKSQISEAIADNQAEEQNDQLSTDAAEQSRLLSDQCDLETNGNVSKVAEERRTARDSASGAMEARDGSDKKDSYVASTPDGSRYRVGTRNRRYLDERSVSFTDQHSVSCDQEPAPDKCQQYIELCMSILKPCCCCRKGRDKQEYLANRRSRVVKNEEDLLIPEDPFRKRCLRACMTFLYVLLVLIGAVVTYSMLQDLVHSMQNPVRSIHNKVVEDYEAPGIAVYPGGAEFLACGHYYNNVVTSKVRLTQLDLVNKTCTYSNMTYTDPHYPDLSRNVMVVRGPTSFKNREAIFLHFALEDDTRDFFTVSYFVFPGYDAFNTSNNKVEQILAYHKYVPTFALSAGLRMWIKLIMSEAYEASDGSKDTEFKVEYSVVRFIDRRPKNQTNRHLFFIFFEWKNDKIEQSRQILTTTPWSIGAGLCGVFLTLHRVYQLAQTSYRRVRKDKQRRSIRKRTLRELRQRSMEAGSLSSEP